MSTLFRRLMRHSVMIMLTSALVLTVVLVPLFTNSLYSQRLETMQTNAKQLGQLVNQMMDAGYSLNNLYLDLNLDIVSGATDSYIMITDGEGRIISGSSGMKRYYDADTFDLSLYPGVFLGRETVNGSAFDRLFGMDMLSLASPILSGNLLRGTVIIATPMPQLMGEDRSLFFMFLFSMLISVTVAMVLSFFLSQRISRPIRRIRQAAKEISTGKFQNRLENCGIEEIDELCTTFNAMSMQLEKLEETRRSFVSNVSHDLRTPMTTITGFVEGILDGTIPPENQPEYLEIVLNETRRLSRLVKEFMDLEQYQGGTLEMQTFDLNDLLRVRTTAFATQLNQRCLQPEYRFQKETAPVRANIGAIERVISNLLENAIKYSEAGGKVILATEQQGKKVLVSVTNYGETIPAEEIPYLFDRFYKVDKSRSSEKESFGLGLYIVKTLLREHGQNIRVTSEKGETCFSFMLDAV